MTSPADLVAKAVLPLGSEFHYLNSAFAGFRQPLAESERRIQASLLQCAAALRPSSSTQPQAKKRGRGGGAAADPASAPAPGPAVAHILQPDWTDADDAAEWASSLLDDALEAVNLALDAHRAEAAAAQQHGEGAGVAAGPQLQLAGVSGTGGTGSGGKGPGKRPVRHSIGLERPQDSFEEPVDNSNTPFRPKVHLPSGGSQQLPPGTHPLAGELEGLTYEPWQLEAPEPLPPRPLAETPLDFVDTPAALRQMVAELRSSRHIAIDLESHSYRSFQGFTCLMQISTRQHDYVVDTLALRPQLGPALAPLLADPAVVKVLHGADKDVEWLQRDFGLYIVNLFDTGQAARVLSLPSCGLAYLLDHYCGVKADKRYQLADWRIRPLSPEMLAYARADTHYLLYMHDRLKQQLVEAGEQVPPSLAVELPSSVPAGALGLVLERSRRLCTRLYEKELLTADSAVESAAKWGLTLTSVQCGVFCAAYEWRDRVCREEDESGGYVLPKTQLALLAQEQPSNVKELRRVLGRAMSEPASRRAGELAAAIAAGKERPRQMALPTIRTSPDTQGQGQPATAAAAAAAATATAAVAAAAAAPAAAEPRPAAAAGPSAGLKAAMPAFQPKVLGPVVAAKALLGAQAAPRAAGGSGMFGRPAGAAAGGSGMFGRPAAGGPAVGPADAVTSAASGQSGMFSGMFGRPAPAAAASGQSGMFGRPASSTTVVAAAAAVAGTGAADAGVLLAAAKATGGSWQGVAVAAAEAASAARREQQQHGQEEETGQEGGAGASEQQAAGRSGAAGVMEREEGVVEEQEEAEARVKRLRASFALPFVSAPAGQEQAGDSAAGAGRKAAGAAAKAAGATARSSGQQQHDDEQQPRPAAASRKDVRSVMDDLIAGGPQSVVLGEGGQAMEGQQGEEEEQQDEEEDEEGNEGGDDEEGAAGEGEEEEEEAAEEEEVGQEEEEEEEDMEQGGAAGVSGRGGAPQLEDTMDYVPMPLSKVRRREDRERREGGSTGAGAGTSKPKGSMSLRDPEKSGQMRDMLKMKYVMGVDPEAGGKAGASDGAEGGSSDGEDSDSEGEDKEESGRTGIFARPSAFGGRKKRKAPKPEQQGGGEGGEGRVQGGAVAKRGAGVVPFDYGAAKAKRQRQSKGGEGGEEEGGGDFPRGAGRGKGRAGGRGRGGDKRGGGRGERGRGRGRGGGKRAGPWSPTDGSADGGHIRAGKRSTTLAPASGNRSHTFRTGK